MEAEVEEEEEEEEERFEQPPVAELRRKPKDPRSAAGWNIFSRLMFVYELTSLSPSLLACGGCCVCVCVWQRAV